MHIRHRRPYRRAHQAPARRAPQATARNYRCKLNRIAKSHETMRKVAKKHEKLRKIVVNSLKA